MAEQLAQFRQHHDAFRSAVVNEPRGSDVLVGALLLPPNDPSCAAGTIFFNNVGMLGMCGHGTIGLVATLAWLGRVSPGEHRIETPVGIVTTRCTTTAPCRSRTCRRTATAADVRVDVPGHGR
jgi:4-hydroxyproline epimerase